MGRLLQLALALTAFFWAAAVSAEVRLTFHSFDGSVLFGRYPHAFVSLEGTLDDGTPIRENYGFSAKSASPAVLAGPVEHVILVEKDKWIDRTNQHFTLTIDDAKYWAIRKEVARWRDAPGRYYSLDSRNCIHFVGAIAQLVGVRVTYPENMLRRPKKWLNHITAQNPQLRAPQID
jgi:hypothetical protein